MPVALLEAAAVALGAAAGALLRWSAGKTLGTLWGLAAGTLVVNVAGSFAAGFLAAALAGHAAPIWRALLVTGFLGGLTTFSTFEAEGLALLMSGRIGLWAAHVGLHVGAGLLACAAGALLGAWMTGNTL